MRVIFSTMLTCIISLGALQLFAQSSDSFDLSPEILTEREAVYDFGEADPLIQEWLRFRRNQQIKQPTDADVDKALRESEIARQILPEVLRQVNQLITDQFHQHILSGATPVSAEPGQPYAWLHHMVSDVAHMLSAPPNAKIRVFVIGGGADAFNAYTWSSTADTYDVVFFEGLLDGMATQYEDADHIRARFQPLAEGWKGQDGVSNEWIKGFLADQTRLETRQVAGHEIFHGRAGHLRNRIHLSILFNAHGQNMIPSPDDPNSSEVLEEIESRKAEIHDALRQAARNILPHAGSMMPNALVEDIVRVIETATERVRASFSAESIDLERQRFQRAIRGLGKDAQVENSKKATKQFREDMDRLSRAQEAGADVAGSIVTQHRTASMMAYRRFTGGRHELPASVEANLQRSFELFAQEGMLETFGLSSGSTHPRSLARAFAMMNVHSTQGYRVLTSPLITTVLDYIAITETLMEMDGKIAGRGRWELSQHSVMVANRTKLAQFAAKLADWISKAVASDFLDSNSELRAFPIVLDLLADHIGNPYDGAVLDPRDRSVAKALALRVEMSRDNRLGARLVQELEAARDAIKEGTDQARILPQLQQAIDIVRGLIPDSKGYQTAGVAELVQAYAKACAGKAKGKKGASGAH